MRKFGRRNGVPALAVWLALDLVRPESFGLHHHLFAAGNGIKQARRDELSTFNADPGILDGFQAAVHGFHDVVLFFPILSCHMVCSFQIHGVCRLIHAVSIAQIFDYRNYIILERMS